MGFYLHERSAALPAPSPGVRSSGPRSS
jgi:hypothetical protein